MSIGLDALTRKHDSYWDIPLNETLTQPVIELPIITPKADEADGTTAQGGLFGEEAAMVGGARVGRPARGRGE